MFGFGRLASYDYFVHLERALGNVLRKGGDEVATWVLDVAPTSSVRFRAARLAELVARTSNDGDGPIHLVGHSTGGIDACLVASPDVHLPCDEEARDWLPRLASVTTLSTPHHGTPLASFFATVSGQRMLYALSALTVIALTLGSPPIAVASALVMAIGRIDHALGLDLKVLDRSTESLLRMFDEARSREVRAYLDEIRADQGAMVQLMPEAMELYQATLRDRPGVLYQCTVSMAPPPSPMNWVRAMTSPWGTLSTSIFAALWGITSRVDPRYPCADKDAGDAEAVLTRVFGRPPGPRANDGVVPLRSQLRGRVVWAGQADHLDVLGHFDGGRPRSRSKDEPSHVDWLRSGAKFDRDRFDVMTRAIADGMRAAAERPSSPPIDHGGR
jgi:triacylglycerol lipase